MTAEQLAKENDEEWETVRKNPNQKFLVLTGEIARVQFNRVEAATVTLKTPKSKTEIICGFTEVQTHETIPLKIGQRIQVVGEPRWNWEKAIALWFCQVLQED